MRRCRPGVAGLQTSQVPGTVELRALFNKEDAAWAWAPVGSGEYDTFVRGGFGSEYDFPVCYVWPR